MDENAYIALNQAEYEEKSVYKNVSEIRNLIIKYYIPNRNKYKTLKNFTPVIFEYLKTGDVK